MNKVKINAWINIFLFLSGAVVAFSGFALLGKSILSFIARDSWKAVHNFAGIIFLVFVLIHLTMHWTWLKNIFKIIK
ncbi:DUF4405 domain-containing protein [Candidatus Woesearchaeota archaeon]|nr:DUF4405 domain-containing protein [Candidatus Woesearchaeota archaeon]